MFKCLTFSSLFFICFFYFTDITFKEKNFLFLFGISLNKNNFAQVFKLNLNYLVHQNKEQII